MARRSSSLIEQLWKQEGFKPNSAQEKAIRHVERPLFISAGPGSGKTRVLLWRTVNLVVGHGVSPDKIYLSTFTEKAARQLKEGLRTLLHKASTVTGRRYDLGRMYVGTIHSLCRKILTDVRFATDGRRRKVPPILEEIDQFLHWQQAFRKTGVGRDGALEICLGAGKKTSSIHDAHEHFLSLFNRLAEECIEPGDLSRAPRGSGLPALRPLYEAYVESLGDNFTDLSRLQLLALRVLEESPDAGKVFEHVIIDEYQDTNAVQERIVFTLAKGHRNLCVVGDDDQALYRFRGATVENFVQFPKRCSQHLKTKPTEVCLDTNYRSLRDVVDFYNSFVQTCNWAREGKGSYRVDKTITSARKGRHPSVVVTEEGDSTMVAEQIADLVVDLLKKKKVRDPNQIAFLYPSLQTKPVALMRQALEERGLKVHAPRATKFLMQPEASDVYGLLTVLFGKPPGYENASGEVAEFQAYLDTCNDRGDSLRNEDPTVDRLLAEKRSQIDRCMKDFKSLERVAKTRKWELNTKYDVARMHSVFAKVPGLSERARRALTSRSVEGFLRARAGNPPDLRYVFNRVTSPDWNLMDLFYELLGTSCFRERLGRAESGQDEGPVWNLAQVSRQLERYTNSQNGVIRSSELATGDFSKWFLGWHLQQLYRLGEFVSERSDDPFPKGRIPFLTIHQSKGLEFPVVVLGNDVKREQSRPIESLLAPLLGRESEPLDRQFEFDAMRMFYVALSRAQNLLVIGRVRGRGQSVFKAFTKMWCANDHEPVTGFDVRGVPAAEIEETVTEKTYSYTGDYLAYRGCPRNYMLFRKFRFAPARSQTAFFGNLVHRTVEDLHRHLIEGRR